MKFSVLISVYCTEKPQYLDRALKSIWDEQLLKPNQIVLVKDGPLTEELDNVIEFWKNRVGSIFDIISLELNVGLGEALIIGIKSCIHDLVARMDSDDISLPSRFLDQIKLFKEKTNLDIIGSNVGEFWEEESVVAFRMVPMTNEDIIKKSKRKNPFNHPSVMYKKKAVLEAGGPQNFTGFDDYFLWIRMIKNGSKCENIQKVLLNMRAGPSLISRRGGFSYLLFEFKFQKMLFNMGYINLFEIITNLMIRFPIRIAPVSLRKLAYKFFRKGI